jgi:WD40 repeat protein
MKRLPLLMVLVLTLGGMLPVRAQESQRPPITAENADQVEELARLGRGWVSEVAWSPDGERLAVGGSVGIWLYRAENPDIEPRLLEGHTEPVESVAWSPDGTRLVSGGRDETVRIWEAVSEKKSGSARRAHRVCV